MLQDLTNRAPAGAGPAAASHIHPGKGAQWADLGKLRLGQAKQHAVVVHNGGAEAQVLSLAQPLPEGFQVLDAAERPDTEWAVPPGGSVALQVVFTPSKEGRVRAVLAFRFGDGTEAGRLAVSAVAVAAGPAAAAAPARAQAKPAAARLVQQPALAPIRTALPPQQEQHHGEKRLRGSAGLATPREPHPMAMPADAGTPSVQQVKRARDASRAPFATAAPAPDPATPQHAVMRQPSSKEAGPAEEGSPGGGHPVVPRLQLGKLHGLPGSSTAALGSSRFAQELGPPPLGSSRLGQHGSPAQGAAPAFAPSFTHFHTSLWMDKQELAFKAWLNTILLPAAAEQAGSGQHALASRRLAARVRGQLWCIYQRDEQFRDTMLRVEERVLAGGLRMRDEEACLKNLQEQAKVRTALMSYHPFWLRLGMEVVVNRAVASGDALVSSAELEAFLRDWFLRDPDLARRHAPNKAVNGLYSKAYWVQLGQLVLSRLLLVVALLDRAMAGALPQGVPLLFNLRSRIKGSGQVLQAILPGWLSGEGDVLRSLGRLGYRLQYEQQPKREVNFAVANLAVDLRDGLRLCKLADVLLGSEQLFEQARFPADKRPVKVHNVQLALGELLRAGLSLDGIKTLKGVGALQPSDVVDGDREKTLALLWRLILRFQLPQLVDAAAVRMEIDRIHTCAAGGAPGTAAAPAAVPSAAACQDHVGLLLQWVQVVCAQYGAAALNFTSAFADGRVFCLLINFYLGNAYLPLREVYQPEPAEAQPPASPATSGSDEEDVEGLEEDAGWRAAHGGSGGSDPAAAARHRQGVAHNFELVHQVAEALGGLPMMVSASDILEHGPDEKAVVLFAAFLCQRLLEMSKEERAAMVMQRLWRRRQLHKPGTARAHLHSWIGAATVVQRAVRAWLLRRGVERFAAQRRRSLAAIVRLQAVWRGRPARQQFLQQRAAAICIQAAYRGKAARRDVFHQLVLPRMLAAALQRRREIERSRYQGRLLAATTAMQALRRGAVQRRAFLRMRAAALVLQAAVRCHQARSSFQRQRAAAVVLQAHWRRRQAMLLLRHNKAAIAIQRHYRGYKARAGLLAQHAAATAIQAWWRGHSQRQAFLQQRAAAVAVQAAFRGWVARRQFCQLRQGAITIQRHWRGHAVRRCIAAQQEAATTIQAAWRAHFQRRAFLRMRAAAIVLQSLARRGAAMQQLLAARQAAVTIQRYARGALVRASVQRQQVAAVRIQAWWRSAMARQHFLQQRAATVRLQAEWRRVQARRQFQQLRAAAIAVQTAWRARQARLLLKQHRAALAVQRLWRSYAVRRSVAQQRTAAVRLQAAWRRHAARSSFLRMRQAAVAIQAAARMAAARAAFLRQRAAAVQLQAAWRGFATRRRLKQTAAAVEVQRHVRGYLVRRRMARQLAAAVAIQRAFRQHLDRKRQRAIADMTRQMRELAAAMQLYTQRAAAALRIQAAWRGHVARLQYAQMQREQQERLRLQREREEAALAVLAPWAGVFRDRSWFLRARKAVRVLQRWWRKEYAQRTVAATRLQAATRRLLAVRQLQRSKEAATRIQTAWRGHYERTTHPKAKRLAELRRRLARANANAVGQAHRSVGARTRVALEGLLAATHLASAGPPLETLALCTEASRACCDTVAGGGGIPVLLRLVASAGRDKSLQEPLRSALLCLANLCRSGQCAGEVFGQPGLLNLLGDLLQHYRDREEVFLAGALLLQRLVAEPARAQAVTRMPEVLAKYEGVARMLSLRVTQEHKYLAKLEGQKGSDASARQATRALVVMARQLHALRHVLDALGVPCIVVDAQQAPSSPGEPLGIGKNTIVRRTLAELSGNR